MNTFIFTSVLNNERLQTIESSDLHSATNRLCSATKKLYGHLKVEDVTRNKVFHFTNVYFSDFNNSLIYDSLTSES